DSLYGSITTPLTERQFYNSVTLLNEKIKDGHTMFLPGEDAMNYSNTHGGFFPFYVFITGEKLFINMNCSADTTISEGSEILSINDKPAKEVLDFLLARQIRDGYNTTYPLWILNTYFKSYFAFSFGQPDSFEIFYKDNGSDKTTVIRALSNDSIR